MIGKEIYELDVADLNGKKDEDLKNILNYVEKYLEYERNRLKNIERKASLYIGSFSISITILSNFLLNSILNKNIFIILSLITLIIFLSIATICAIKVFEKKKYYTFGSYIDIKKILKSECVLKETIVQFYNNTQKNRSVINKKVDYMNLSQFFFECAIYITIIFIIIRIVYHYL